MENGGQDLYIGSYIGGGGSEAFHFQGDLGQCWITGEELSAADIWKLYIGTRGYYNL